MKSQYPNITVDPHTDTMEMVLPLNSTASSQRTLRPHPHTCNLQQEQLARSRHAHTHSLTRSVLSFCPVSVLDVASVASKKSSTALHTCTFRPDFGSNKSPSSDSRNRIHWIGALFHRLACVHKFSDSSYQGLVANLMDLFYEFW